MDVFLQNRQLVNSIPDVFWAELAGVARVLDPRWFNWVRLHADVSLDFIVHLVLDGRGRRGRRLRLLLLLLLLQEGGGRRRVLVLLQELLVLLVHRSRARPT